MPQGLRILVVGNPPDVTQRLAPHLRADGHELATVATGPAALAAAHAALPDVVFLDLAHPGIDGYAVARGMQALSVWRRPMVVALAAQAVPVRQSQEAGIDLLLVKPVAPGEVRRFLRRFQALLQDLTAFDPAI